MESQATAILEKKVKDKGFYQYRNIAKQIETRGYATRGHSYGPDYNVIDVIYLGLDNEVWEKSYHYGANRQKRQVFDEIKKDSKIEIK